MALEPGESLDTPPPPSPEPIATTPRTASLIRARASTWSIFRPQPSPPPASDGDPALPFKPSHTPPGSFSLSSIASVLKRPLVSPSAHHQPLPISDSPPPSQPQPSPSVSPGADPDPTPSVPFAPPRLVVETEPADETAGAFDFNLFLEQMRWRQSEPIAKYLRSFLKEFSKHSASNGGQANVGEQVRVVNNFLDFISVKMREIKGGPWDPKICSDPEFDNAVEAMEKLVMNRVWHLTYTPALPTNLQPSATDDLERDTVLSQKMNLFDWVTDRHLDLELERDECDGFLEFAKTELLKINSYKAPRDKMICILNCCKVIFGLIRHISQSEGGADTFVPILILVVLRAQPEHLISNMQYIQRFRNPDKLQGENGYYLSSLDAAISFIERLEHSVLSNISQEEFEANVEQAISTLPRSPTQTVHTIPPLPSTSPQTLPGSSSFPDLTRTWLFNTVPNLAEKAVSKPLNAIARIVDDLSHDHDEMRSSESGSSSVPENLNSLLTPHPSRRPSLQTLRRSVTSPAVPTTRRRGARPWSAIEAPHGEKVEGGGEEEMARIESLKRAEHEAKLDTLASIFADLEREVLEVVLVTHNGQLSVAIDSVLEMS